MLKRIVYIESPLSRSEFLSRLHENLVSKKPRFEGTIKEESFIIYQLFDYGPNNMLRPKIIGKIHIHNGKLGILVEFSLSIYMKLLLFGALGLNLLFIALGSPSFFANNRLLGLAFVVATAAILIVVYLQKVNRCIDILLLIANGRIRKSKPLYNAANITSNNNTTQKSKF